MDCVCGEMWNIIIHDIFDPWYFLEWVKKCMKNSENPSNLIEKCLLKIIDIAFMQMSVS